MSKCARDLQIIGNVVSNFSRLCVPTQQKVEYLLKKYAHLGAYYQESSKPPSKWSKEPEDAGVVIPARTKAKKLIISHIDLVSNFERGFAAGKTFSLVPFDAETLTIQGGLDNGITNSFLCAVIDELGELPEDVEILFSLGEESGLTGVAEFMSSKPESYFDGLFVVNLDVTNANFGSAASIEFDFEDPVISERLNSQLEDIGITRDRFCDDTDEVLNWTKAAFSYCIPTDEYCHTYQSYALVEKFPAYFEGLRKIITEVDFSDYDSSRVPPKPKTDWKSMFGSGACMFQK